MDDCLGTADTRLYGNRFFRAIAGTGAALHARIAIGYPGKAIVYCQNTVRADHSTHPAPGASVVENLKCGHVGKVFHADPPDVRNALIQRTMAITEAPIWTGTAIRISFLTPERDV